MTMDQLKKMCVETRAQGGSSLYLKVNVKRQPRGAGIRIAGFGNGILINEVRLPDGTFDCTCMFRLATVEKNILKHELGARFK